MPMRSGGGPGEVKSAARALEILEYLASRESASFAEIVDALAIPRSSAHGLLQTLEHRGWIGTSDSDRRVRLGLAAWQVGRAFNGHRQIVDAAQPVMDALMAATGETVQLARLEGIENVYIGISVSPHPMRMVSSVGMRLQSHGTGIGKALLSTFSDAAVRQRYRQAELERFTPKTVRSVDELVERLSEVRANGYALDDEEFIEGCRCVAMALTSADETGFATAMSITMPTSRSGEEWPLDQARPLRDAVAEVRRRLGLA